MSLKEYVISFFQPKESILQEPHEIFPDIIDWESGDQLAVVNIHYSTLPESATYIGLLEGNIYFKCRGYDGLSELPIKEVAAKVQNTALESRRSKEKEKRVLAGIKTDEYNMFLKILKEQKNKLWSEWANK
jgi:hypothetical protein